MKRIFKLELKRAVINKMFLVSLLIGCTIAFCQFFYEVIPMREYLQSLVERGLYPHSVFNKWIGGTFSSFWGSLFFTISPILAALPFSDSLFTDKKDGYVKNLFTRTNKGKYFVSKYIAVFLSGACAVTIPLIFNFYLSSLVLPCVIPDPSTGTFMIMGFHTWANLYFGSPFLYVFIYLTLIFFVSGILTTVALSLSFFVKHKYIVVLTPFLFFELITFLSRAVSVQGLDICSWMQPYQPVILDLSIALPEMLTIFAITLLIYIFRSKNDEVY